VGGNTVETLCLAGLVDLGLANLGLAGQIRPTAPATIFFIFSCGSCSGGFDFLIFSDGSCFWICFLVFFFLGFSLVPVTFR
jgi:hypothetical protein